MALPHGKSSIYTEQLADFKGIIIDLGADHRLEEENDWNKFYSDAGKYHGKWTYGLPELFIKSQNQFQKEVIQKANRVAVAGCNVTAVTLALQPLLNRNCINTNDIVITLANGYSGAGKSLKSNLLAINAIDNVQAYSIAGTHRHIPEIIQNFALTSNISKSDLKPSIIPLLVPINRGIFATISCSLNDSNYNIDSSDIRNIYHDFYSNESLVNILPANIMPEINQIIGKKYANINFKIDKISNRILILCAIDNLLRGTASMAIDCMNLMLKSTVRLNIK